MLLETARNLCASQQQAVEVLQLLFSILELGCTRKTKHLMTACRKQRVLLSLDQNVLVGIALENIEICGETELTVSLGVSH